MNFSRACNHTLIAGNTGSGKSSLARHLVRTSKAARVIAFDHDGQLSTLLGLRPVTDVSSLGFAARAFEAGKGGVLPFYPGRLFPGRAAAGFAWFCRVVWNWHTADVLTGETLFYTDEIQKFARAGKGDVPVEFLAMGQEGRRYGLDLLLMTLSVNRVHCDVRDMMQRIYHFNAGGELATSAAEDFGFDPAELSALQRFHYVMRDRAGNCERGKTRKDW
jgi:hypothetical protein